MSSMLAPTLGLGEACQNLNCVFRPCARGYEIRHLDTLIGYIPNPWQAERLEGWKTYHASPILAVLALLTTHYTPKKENKECPVLSIETPRASVAEHARALDTAGARHIHLKALPPTRSI